MSSHPAAVLPGPACFDGVILTCSRAADAVGALRKCANIILRSSGLLPQSVFSRPCLDPSPGAIPRGQICSSHTQRLSRCDALSLCPSPYLPLDSAKFVQAAQIKPELLSGHGPRTVKVVEKGGYIVSCYTFQFRVLIIGFISHRSCRQCHRMLHGRSSMRSAGLSLKRVTVLLIIRLNLDTLLVTTYFLWHSGCGYKVNLEGRM